jgi:hypothetical protein
MCHTTYSSYTLSRAAILPKCMALVREHPLNNSHPVHTSVNKPMCLTDRPRPLMMLYVEAGEKALVVRHKRFCQKVAFMQHFLCATPKSTAHSSSTEIPQPLSVLPGPAVEGAADELRPEKLELAGKQWRTRVRADRLATSSATAPQDDPLQLPDRLQQSEVHLHKA